MEENQPKPERNNTVKWIWNVIYAILYPFIMLFSLFFWSLTWTLSLIENILIKIFSKKDKM